MDFLSPLPKPPPPTRLSGRQGPNCWDLWELCASPWPLSQGFSGSAGDLLSGSLCVLRDSRELAVDVGSCSAKI